MDTRIFTRIGVTGQRPQHMRPSEREFARDELRRIVAKLTDEHGAEEACSGMALGVDQWFALEVVRQSPALDLVAFLPFEAEDQMSTWTEADQILYRSLLDLAVDRRVIAHLPPKGHPKRRQVLLGAYHRRNQAMVDWVGEGDEPGCMVVVTNGRRQGGTWDCLQRIVKANLPFVYVDTKAERTSFRPAVKVEEAEELASVVDLADAADENAA